MMLYESRKIGPFKMPLQWPTLGAELVSAITASITTSFLSAGKVTDGIKLGQELAEARAGGPQYAVEH